MFNVGDRVVVTSSSSPYFGSGGKIIDVAVGANNMCKVGLNQGKSSYFYEYEIAKVKTVPPPSAPVPPAPVPAKGSLHIFAVGDHVTVTKSSDPYYTWEGEIKAITDTCLCEVEFIKGPVTITLVYSPRHLSPIVTGLAPVAHSKKPEPELCPQCHDEKSYDGGSILDITKKMF